MHKLYNVCVLYPIASRPSDHYFRSVCWFVSQLVHPNSANVLKCIGCIGNIRPMSNQRTDVYVQFLHYSGHYVKVVPVIFVLWPLKYKWLLSPFRIGRDADR